VRRCRYLGQAKTHLQHVFTAVAINLVCLGAWLQSKPWAEIRQSRLFVLAPFAV
jgi:transposase